MKAGFLAGLALLGAGLAHAQQPAAVIAFLDKNGDGLCDLSEYLAYQTPRIAQFDKDGDGELNLGEFRESLQGKAKMNAPGLFKASNAEGGRTLTQREFLGYQAWVFKTYIDSNKDGFMTADEWTAIMDRAS